MGKKELRFFAIVSAFCIAIMLCLGLFLSTTRTDEQASTLRVEYNGKEIDDGESVALATGGPVRFDVGYELEWLTGERGFYVKVVPRITSETNFTFSYDWYQKAYSDVTSLNVGFDLQAGKDYFTLQVPGDLGTILQKQFPANTISGTPSALDSGIDYFTIVILSDDQSEQIKVNFHITTTLSGVGLDKETIVF